MTLLVFGDPDDQAVEAVQERFGPVDVVRVDDLLAQLDERVPVALIGTTGFEGRPDRFRAALHAASQHLEPGGVLALTGALQHEVLIGEFDLAAQEGDEIPGLTVRRRTSRFTVHDLVFEARSCITRIRPEQLHELLVDGTPPTIIDTRTHVDRERHGVIPGSIHSPRTVLEWHLEPANGYRHADVQEFDQPLVIVCNGGYSSSLAAASLKRIGYTDVSDLVGGHQGWIRAGLPTVPPDHSHLGL